MLLDNFQCNLREENDKHVAVLVTLDGDVVTSNAFETKTDCLSAVTFADKIISVLKASEKHKKELEKKNYHKLVKIQQMLPTIKETLYNQQRPNDYPVKVEYSQPSKIYTD